MMAGFPIGPLRRLHNPPRRIHVSLPSRRRLVSLVLTVVFYLLRVEPVNLSSLLSLSADLRARAEAETREPVNNGEKADRWIKMALEHGMIEPFVEGQAREHVVSYGLSRTATTSAWPAVQGVYQRLRQRHRSEAVRPAIVRRHEGGCLHHPAQLFALAGRSSISSSARRAGGLPGQIDLCPLRHHRQRHAVEPECKARSPSRFEHNAAAGEDCANEGIAQVLFYQSDEVCENSNEDKKGKYQAQRGLTLPTLWHADKESRKPNRDGAMARRRDAQT